VRKFLASLCLWVALTASAAAQLPLVGAGAGKGSFSPPSAPTTFNPADKGSLVTLSNGNLTASYNTTPDDGVRAIASTTGTKKYFEATITAGFGSVDNGVGISIAGESFQNLANNAAGGAVLFSGGNIWINGTNTLSSGISLASLVTIGVALDTTANLIWFTHDGTHWNSTSSITNNPATGVGGVSFSGLSGQAMFPVVLMGASAGTNHSWTGNFGATSFTYTVPVGFSIY
jgi:hypothetical protein